jgi:hypothetical protein
MQWFSSPCLTVVDERQQRMEPEAAFERRRRVFLLRVRRHQRRVEIDDQRRGRIRAVVGCVLAGQRPHFLPRGGLGLFDRRECPVDVRGEGVDQPRHGGVEATRPNTPGSARSRFTSARQSPPSANAIARSSTMLPGSCTANGLRHGESVSDAALSIRLVGIVSSRQMPCSSIHSEPSASPARRPSRGRRIESEPGRSVGALGATAETCA